MLPLLSVIVGELIRLKGTVKDKDLFKHVKDILSAYNGDVSLAQFNKAIMSLELRGIVRVESVKRGVRMIYLVRDEVGGGGGKP